MNGQDRKAAKMAGKKKKPSMKKGDPKYEADKLTSYKGKHRTKLA